MASKSDAVPALDHDVTRPLETQEFDNGSTVRENEAHEGVLQELQQVKRSTTDMSRPHASTSGSERLLNGLSKTTTQDFGTSEAGFTPPKRVRTAPAEQRKRPGLGPRKSTLLGGMKRSRTGLQPKLGRQDTFQYSFKEAPLSDSESGHSSSSEEEVEKAAETTSATPQVGQQLDGNGNDAGEGTEDEQKKAKKRYDYSRFTIGNDLFKTRGRVSRKDGRLKISITETANSGYIAKALGQSIRNHLDIPCRESNRDRNRSQKKRIPTEEADAESIASSLRTILPPPRLNIVIMVIGSRGDIQPFIKIGKILRHEHGHRVRIASHPVFRDFVEKDGGLEFFSVGGDPSELMAFMVKNPGLVPNMQTLREGEIGRRRAAMAEMFEGFWRACINTMEGEKDAGNLTTMRGMEPFVADAIIANPPSMAHVHIAERLGVPLHMMFTYVYTKCSTKTLLIPMPSRA